MLLRQPDHRVEGVIRPVGDRAPRDRDGAGAPVLPLADADMVAMAARDMIVVVRRR